MEQFLSSNNNYLLQRQNKYPFLNLVDTEQNFKIVWSLQHIFEIQKSQEELEQIKQQEYETFTIDTTYIKKGFFLIQFNSAQKNISLSVKFDISLKIPKFYKQYFILYNDGSFQLKNSDSIDIHEFEMEKIWGSNKISALERVFNFFAYISYFIGPLLQALEVITDILQILNYYETGHFKYAEAQISILCVENSREE
ncbi:hypothetical protein PPERSA_12741 [Pseudocohnilembus persalinus]|uniref:Uncharacterized protein n=1 Tax=Pseudocohnilembus persalinus TaxID=266149 RepID=A0A0V0QTP0_PSEPJ|nr:hypothetical protein PPERSA_12741 [Pseudocohnilembus persalinus]|eukprot:KRX05563.1 hypothetical protein PPERSA_12741 [Pseudocohnilembus persalinus]